MIAIWARAEVDDGRRAARERGRKEGAEVEETGMIRIVWEEGAGPAGVADSSEWYGRDTREVKSFEGARANEPEEERKTRCEGRVFGTAKAARGSEIYNSLF